MSVTPDRAHWLKNIHLAKGYHRAKTPGEWCLMEAAAYIAGEPWSDHPKCVSTVLTAYGMALNDSLDDDQRQKLIPFIPRMLGTANDGQDEARSYLALDWLMRTYTPAWLDLAGLAAEATALREHPQIMDTEALHSIRSTASAARWAASTVAAHSVATVAAQVAADAAAHETSLPVRRAAAYLTAFSLEYTAASTAAYAAAYTTSFSAARVAVHETAREEMWVVLAPTVEALQESALDLFDAMIDPRRATQENV
jgi:hypothetical protein